ncbi:serine hydrolase domain-containing protein [Bacillus testis]|uniref:serine hydrolase domain-containing protein n=1 Tax=Bacillus testis TaxID=1622072 RepID=UPI00067E6839|nr:serine hydrolase domain-containing protein [Bacillus testis]
MLEKKETNQFQPVLEHVQSSYEQLKASAAACIVIHKDNIAAEKYWGTIEKAMAPPAMDYQFYVASVRKCYIGYAAAYCVVNGFIDRLDDLATTYIDDLPASMLEGVTIRHLLTHTHGLQKTGETMAREFAPGTGWAYRGINIHLLDKIIKKTSGLSIQDIVRPVFKSLGFKHTGWQSIASPNMVKVLSEDDYPPFALADNTDGSQMNMYVSPRELAFWGYLHLKKGRINESQLVPEPIIKLATSLHTPEGIPADDPRNGCLWFVKDGDRKRSEIGPRVPDGSYQILGYTGVTLLVIPSLELCAVRMFNRLGSTPGYDYLEDVRTFGDSVAVCALAGLSPRST